MLPVRSIGRAATRRAWSSGAPICAVLLVSVLGASTVPAHSEAGASLIPSRLRTEYRSNPLGIDSPEPRLSWVLEPADQGLRSLAQTAYRIRVASRPELLQGDASDLWDSGKVVSSATLHVAYRGRPLVSGERAYWNVEVWDQDGVSSGPSEAAWWEMGLFREEDWAAAWIKGARPTPESEEAWYGENPAPLLRKEFELEQKAVERARVYVTGLGYYELRLNGERVGDHVLDPGWTDYDERVLYAVYDVTRHVRPGANALGLELGNGWYNPLPLKIFGRWQLRETLATGDPKAILRLVVEYTDGSSRSVVTDASWKTADGPVVKNNIYLGEVYDARDEQPGWDLPGFDDASWRPVREATPPRGALRAQDAPPIKIMRSIDPVALWEQSPGVYLFDMGENFAGWVTLRVQGAPGDRVVLRFGERLHETGELDVLTSAMTQIKNWDAVRRRDWKAVLAGPFWNQGPFRPETAWQGDTYILKGEGVESYTPRFTWHGFRYVEMRGYPGAPSLESLRGHVLYSSVDDAGVFASSNELLNRIQEITMRAMRSNLFSVESDCPHRERFGYGGDIVAASEMGLFNLDMSRFYAKAVADFADAVRPNGGFTEIAPDVGIDSESLGGGSGPVGWGTAHPMLVRQLFQYYGDHRLMETEVDRVRRYVDLLSERAVDFVLDNGISDHESLEPKPRALTGTAFYHYNTRLLAEMARLLGRSDDAARYGALADSIKAAFNRQFLDPATGAYDIGTQAAQAFALYFDLVPDDVRSKALARLVSEVEAHDRHLNTGIFGTKYLLNVLTRYGRSDLAYAVAAQRSFPGYGFMVENGATTLWEQWAEPDQASHNHPMFGSVSEWFYKALLGIRPAPDAVGFDRLELRPEAPGDLDWVRGHYDSVRGRIESAWTVEGNRMAYEATVPVGVSARVVLPASRPQDVLEGGVPADQAPGVRLVERTEKTVAYEVGSGRYRFVVTDFKRP